MGRTKPPYPAAFRQQIVELRPFEGFTAAQAAQKVSVKHDQFDATFTAAQAAQKWPAARR